jgi:hypothetical protein
VFKRRGSFKVAPGVRVNYGRRGFTSINVGGVMLGSSRPPAGSRPTKTAVLAEQWRLKPGIHFVRVEVDESDWIDLVVDGGELTFGRVERIRDGLYSGDTAAVARAFRSFVKAWDVVGDHGTTLPINQGSVDRLGIELVFGLTVEAANALNIPKAPLGNVLKHRGTGAPLRVAVSDRPLPSTKLPIAPGILRQADDGGLQREQTAARRKSTGMTYALWLVLGLVGGHRYYLRRYRSAFLMTVTLGGVGI